MRRATKVGMEKQDKKGTVGLELEPGDYIVSIHYSHQPRIWKIKATGEIIGMGRALKRVGIYHTLAELTRAAEEDEGVEGVHLTIAKKVGQ